MLLPDEPVLYIGERLRVVCPEVPELCLDRSIGVDGTIDLPSIGPVVAVLKRPSEVAQDIAGRAPGLLLPQVRIDVLGGASDEVSVQGSVTYPLHLYAPGGIDFDRLIQAAGVLPEADRALIERPGRVRPGTSITVPTLTASRQISIVGAVVSPIALPAANGLSLESALETAGGLTAHADPQAIVVVRAEEAIPVRLPADAKFRLLPGDLVRVGLLADRRYIVVKGLVARPGSVEYAPGMTLTRALAAAGGVLPAAKVGTVVWQTGAKSFRLSLDFLYARRIPDAVLGPDDSLVVEAAKP